MVRMRRTESCTAAFASRFVNRRDCRRSSDEIVCRLFFTRWWISRIVASLLSSNRSRLRSSVTSRTSRSPPSIRGSSSPCGVVEDRHATAQQGDVAALLELLDDRLPALERLADGAVVESEFGEAHADRVGLDPDAVQRRVGVRRHVRDRAGGVDGEHAVADSRCGARVGDAARERERARLDHAGELLERDRVVAFEVARSCGRHARVHSLLSTAIDATVATYGDGQHPPDASDRRRRR